MQENYCDKIVKLFFGVSIGILILESIGLSIFIFAQVTLGVMNIFYWITYVFGSTNYSKLFHECTVYHNEHCFNENYCGEGIKFCSFPGNSWCYVDAVIGLYVMSPFLICCCWCLQNKQEAAEPVVPVVDETIKLA